MQYACMLFPNEAGLSNACPRPDDPLSCCRQPSSWSGRLEAVHFLLPYDDVMLIVNFLVGVQSPSLALQYALHVPFSFLPFLCVRPAIRMENVTFTHQWFYASNEYSSNKHSEYWLKNITFDITSVPNRWLSICFFSSKIINAYTVHLLLQMLIHYAV